MLDRCQLVQDTLCVNRTKQHSNSSPQASSSGSSRHMQPSTPPTGPASAPYSKQQGAHMYLTNRSQLLFKAPAHGTSSSSNSAGASDTLQQQDRQQGWAGCVDLNPGFAFRPGACTCLSVRSLACSWHLLCLWASWAYNRMNCAASSCTSGLPASTVQGTLIMLLVH